MYITMERLRKCHCPTRALSNSHLFVVAVAAALSYTASASNTEYWFSTKRCSAKQADDPPFGQTTKCDDSCTGTDDDYVGCSWSYPIGDPLGKRSDDAACRCNPNRYRWGNHIKNPKKCNNECADGVNCQNSWPFYMFKAPKEHRINRCKDPDNGDLYNVVPGDGGDGGNGGDSVYLDLNVDNTTVEVDHIDG